MNKPDLRRPLTTLEPSEAVAIVAEREQLHAASGMSDVPPIGPQDAAAISQWLMADRDAAEQWGASVFNRWWSAVKAKVQSADHRAASQRTAHRLRRSRVYGSEAWNYVEVDQAGGDREPAPAAAPAAGRQRKIVSALTLQTLLKNAGLERRITARVEAAKGAARAAGKKVDGQALLVARALTCEPEGAQYSIKSIEKTWSALYGQDGPGRPKKK